MDPRIIVRQQIVELQRRMKRVAAAIGTGQPAIDARLLQRVRLRFAQRLLTQDQSLERARQRTLDSSSDPAECWDLFRPVRDECQALLSEALAVLQGALARTARLDDGFCDAVDRLIAELGEYAQRTWNRFTILDIGELYSDVADVIRVRFPCAGIWDLPVAAHECGHFLGMQMWQRDPTGASHDVFQEFLFAQNAAPNTRLGRQLHEHFADAFATFAVGPAYACTALLLRFDLSRADRDDDSHPSPADRAYAILRTLEWMDQPPGRPFAGLIQMLRQVWPPPNPQACVAIDTYLDDWLHPMLDSNFPLVRYGTWPRAMALARELSAPEQPPTGVSLRDLMNAAWLARLEAPDSLPAIEQASERWCAAPIVSRGGAYG